MKRLHRPVMTSQVTDYMGSLRGGRFADLTFGEGGHTEILLDGGAARVIAVDRDLEAIEHYREQGRFRSDPRLSLHHAPFSTFSTLFSDEHFDGILLDLGVSTRQLLTPERGFSFLGEAALDMRMDRSDCNPVAPEVIRTAPLADIAHHLEIAGVRRPDRVAKLLKDQAINGLLRSTQDLSNLARGAHDKGHPATQLFLGVRLLVNRELDEISSTLPALVDRVHPGGRIVVITFHSTEDRLVKRSFASLSGKCICESVFCDCPRIQRVTILTPKPIIPTREETYTNRRARSAKLRAVMRIENDSVHA